MSNSDLNKADGCDVFFSFLIAVTLLAGFFAFQYIMEPQSVNDVNFQVNQERLDKIDNYKTEDSSYKSTVDTFHSDLNSSLETVMSKTIEKYISK